jgi:hypothetical protein
MGSGKVYFLWAFNSCKPYFPHRLPPHLSVLPGYLSFFLLFSFPFLFFASSLSFFFFLSIFYLFSFLPSFNILIAILDGARKGIINSYQHFY